MIEVTQAVKLAKQYAKELFADEDIKHLGLEEVVFESLDNEWHVTLGYDSYRVKTRGKPASNTMGDMGNIGGLFASNSIETETLREYKTFRLNGENGEFRGMLMRDIG